MNKEKKVEKILDTALTEDLTDYVELLKIMKKRLPFFSGTKRIAAALLKEHLGDISRLSLTFTDVYSKPGTGQVMFEDIKDGKARIFINIGKSHNVSPGDLIREIVKRSGIDGKLVGKIDIHATYSFIEIPEQYAEIVMISLDKTKMKGIPIVVEPAKRRKKEG
ncbi:MAG TPA: DbpA RNA binding domain-containing protein [Spirochaetota bacterium]|nr:DbpA RNA binding domain-containing protein [Spirochaetota bacterium]HQO01694.1 DbpA RNA binding domain-containing protein [Spirochaetota bacterium]HQP48711.1 DbpA RNA binding domain-containing protein [Spirochaetota bacterium]